MQYVNQSYKIYGPKFFLNQNDSQTNGILPGFPMQTGTENLTLQGFATCIICPGFKACAQ